MTWKNGLVDFNTCYPRGGGGGGGLVKIEHR